MTRSETLQRKLDLAERALRSMSLSSMTQQLWRDVQKLSVEEEDDEAFDLAVAALSQLKILHSPRACT